MLLCGGSRDPVVDFDNTRAAAAALAATAGAAVTVIDIEQVAVYQPFLGSGALPAIRIDYHARTVAALPALGA